MAPVQNLKVINVQQKIILTAILNKYNIFIISGTEFWLESKAAKLLKLRRLFNL